MNNIQISSCWADALVQLEKDLIGWSKRVVTETWQGIPADKPELATNELQFYTMAAPLRYGSLDYHRRDISPNLPWADDHFMERVGGEPLNPGVEWANWPHGKSADRFRDEHGQFSHNYMERYWPKYAGLTDKGELSGTRFDPDIMGDEDSFYMRKEAHRHGIRFPYGDLDDLITLLHKQPFTRAAYLPIFFPEDTGVVHGTRVPCSLGYDFMHRDGYLSVAYYMRSCDAANHLRDDIYLTVRLLLFILEKLRTMDDRWNKVKPGTMVMHVKSMHIFANDFIELKQKYA